MIGKQLDQVRSKKPRVHCIANYVTAGDCANLLLAVGASAIMADDPLESAEITACCDALTISLGTPNERKLEALRLSCELAQQKGIPVVFDPVGVTASSMRREWAEQLLDTCRIAVIRGNASEIRVLAGEKIAACGLEASDDASDVCVAACRLAVQTGAIVVMTGETDIVSDGRRVCRIHNGHEILRSITGAGCQLTAMLGAFVGADPQRIFDASAAAVCMMGLCGEIACGRMKALDGNASCRNYIIDAAYTMTVESLRKGAKYEM